MKNISVKACRDLEEFLKNPNIYTKLDLDLKGIDNEGAIALVRALNDNKSLTDLILYNNSIIDDDGTVALAHNLVNNSSLNYIHLDVNKIGSNGYLTLYGSEKINNTRNNNNKHAESKKLLYTPEVSVGQTIIPLSESLITNSTFNNELNQTDLAGEAFNTEELISKL